MATNEQTILEKEEEILTEEKEILAEIKAEERSISRLIQSVWFAAGLVAVVILSVAGGAFYAVHSSSRIAIEKAEISAPLIQALSAKCRRAQRYSRSRRRRSGCGYCCSTSW